MMKQTLPTPAHNAPSQTRTAQAKTILGTTRGPLAPLRPAGLSATLAHTPRMAAQRQAIRSAFGPTVVGGGSTCAAQRETQDALPSRFAEVAQRSEADPPVSNRTGVLHQLKAGAEALSDTDHSDERMSDKSAQLAGDNTQDLSVELQTLELLLSQLETGRDELEMHPELSSCANEISGILGKLIGALKGAWKDDTHWDVATVFFTTLFQLVMVFGQMLAVLFEPATMGLSLAFTTMGSIAFVVISLFQELKPANRKNTSARSLGINIALQTAALVFSTLVAAAGTEFGESLSDPIAVALFTIANAISIALFSMLRIYNLCNNKPHIDSQTAV